jgi:hypothetical protein
MISLCLSRPQEQRAAITAKMQARSDQLMATYTQIALQFADLHDRPERMLAKDAISRIVDWKAARVTFYWRLKRRVLGVWSIPANGLGAGRERARIGLVDSGSPAVNGNLLVAAWPVCWHLRGHCPANVTIASFAAEEQVLRRVVAAQGGKQSTRAELLGLIGSWHGQDPSNDEAVAHWLEGHSDAIEAKLKEMLTPTLVWLGMPFCGPLFFI